MQFYVAAAAFYPVLSKLRTNQWLVLIAAGCALSAANYYASPFIPPMAHNFIGVTLFPYAYMFFIGSWLYSTREQALLPLAKHIVALVAVYVATRIVILVSGITVPGTYRDMIMSLFVPVITVGVAYASGRHRLGNDYSYGIYIYHMIVVNILVHLRLIGSYKYLLIAFTATFILAFASWSLIEKPCLRLKHYV